MAQALARFDPQLKPLLRKCEFESGPDMRFRPFLACVRVRSCLNVAPARNVANRREPRCWIVVCCSPGPHLPLLALHPSAFAVALIQRDPRMVERKKPGQKKARKQFQWVKR